MSSDMDLELTAMIQLVSLKTKRPFNECYREYVMSLDKKLCKAWNIIKGFDRWWKINTKKYKIAYTKLKELDSHM